MTNAEQRFSQRQSLYDACLVTDRPDIRGVLFSANPNKLPGETSASPPILCGENRDRQGLHMAINPGLHGILGEKVPCPDE